MDQSAASHPETGTPVGPVPGTVIVTTVKNEGPFLLEWVAYHRLVGFERLVVFANDCTDGSDRLLTALHDAGLIEYHDNSATPEGLPADPQNRAYRRAFAMPHVAEADWVLTIDGDEFFTIHAGAGHLSDLLAALPEGTGVVGAPWRIFGTGGVIGFEDRPQIGRYTRAAPIDLPVSFNHYGLKCLFRPGPVHRMGVHRPFFRGEFQKPGAPLVWVNGSGEDVTDHYRTRGWAASPQTVGYGLCQVSHYMIRASELFLMKRWRGTANSSDTDRINFDYYDQFNSNHEPCTDMRRWLAPVQEEMARLRAAHPALGILHDACVAYFKDRIAALKAEVAETAPEIHARLFDPATVAKEIRAQEAWLANKRAKLGLATPDAPIEPDTDEAEDLPADPPASPAPQDATDTDIAPAWLADLRRTDFRRGFYHSDDGFAAIHTDRGPDRLVIAFDNLSSVRDPALNRGPWGYEFIRKSGWSQLGLLAFRAEWFRDPALFAYLQGLRDQGFFARFRSVTLMGTSMGGYAACAFASLVPGATVIAFSPQSTLDARLVPWETRFGSGRKADWSGPYADGAAEVASASRVYLFYDPAIEGDRLHADRFTGDNVLHLRTRFAGHKSALFLRRAELLSTVVRGAVQGTLDEAGFYALYRGARGLPWYVNALCEKAVAADRPDLARRTLRAVQARGQAALAMSVTRRLKL